MGFDGHADQFDAAGQDAGARLVAEALIGNQGVYAAPGQLEIGDAPADLVGLGEHDDLPRDIGHDPG